MAKYDKPPRWFTARMKFVATQIIRLRKDEIAILRELLRRKKEK